MGKKAASTTALRSLIAGSVVLVMCLIAYDASADVVVMKNGSRFEGKILQETPEKIVLHMKLGTMDFQRKQIKEIIKKVVYKPPPPKSKPKDEKPKPDGQEPKPEGEPKTPEEKAKPVVLPKLGSRGRVTVVQRIQATSTGYAMDVKDAVAIVYRDDPNKMVEVNFLPFKLSEEDIAFLRKAKGSEVASLVGRKSSPDEKYWEDRCPYVFVKIKFEEGKERKQGNISECQACFSQFVYPDEKAVEIWKDRRGRQAVSKIELYMNGDEGVLVVSFTGRFSSTRQISKPAQTHGYTWNLNVKCRAFVK